MSQPESTGFNVPYVQWRVRPLHAFALVAGIAFVFFTWIGAHTDFSKREAREVLPIVNFFKGESFFIPKVDDSKLRTKPPLFYWAGWLSAKLSGGVSELSVRMVSILAGTGTVFFTCLLGYRLFNWRTAVMGGLMLMTCLRFAYLAGHARVDMLFCFFLTGCLVAGWTMIHGNSPEARNRAGWITALGLALAMLSKGPLGLLFIFMTLFLFNRWGPRAPIPWWRLLGVPLVAVLLWFVIPLVLLGEEFYNLIYQETIARVTGETTSHLHREPFYYYVPQFIFGLLPWGLFLPVALWLGFRKRYDRPGWRYALLGLIGLFVFLSVLTGKRLDYLLPVFPLAALLVSATFDEWISGSRDGYLGFSLPVHLLVKLSFLSALALALLGWGVQENWDPREYTFISYKDRMTLYIFLKDYAFASFWIYGAAVGMTLAGIRLWVLLRKRRVLQVFAHMMGFIFFLWVIGFGPGAQAVNKHNSYRPFAQKLNAVVGDGTLFFSRGYREDMVYYLNRTVPEQGWHEAAQTLATQPGHYLLLKEKLTGEFLQLYPQFQRLMGTDTLIRNYDVIVNPQLR